MPVTIRLARHGKKHNAFFHIVVADSRAPRDGQFIEKIGTYNPNTNPVTVVLDNEKALQWIQKGAQPSDTARTILSFRGVMYKNHLLKGVTKGALTAEQAEQKFQQWLSQKEGKAEESRRKIVSGKEKAAKERHEAETKAREEKAKAIAARQAAAEAPAAPAAPAVEEAAPPAAEEPKAE